MFRKLLSFLFGFLLLLSPLSIGLFINNTASAYTWDNCKISSYSPSPLTTSTKLINQIAIDVGGRAVGARFKVLIGNYGNPFRTIYHPIESEVIVNSSGNLTINVPFDPDGHSRPDGTSGGNPFNGKYIFLVVPEESPNEENNLCGNGTSEIPNSMQIDTTTSDTGGEEYCTLIFTSSSGEFKPGDTVTAKVNFPDTEKGRSMYGNDSQQQEVKTTWNGGGKPAQTSTSKDLRDTGININGPFIVNVKYSVTVYNHSSPTFNCKNTFKLDINGGCSDCDSTNLIPNTPLSLPCPTGAGTYSTAQGCTKIHTAVGDVGTGAPAFTRWVLGFILSISGGIVLIIIIISGYRLMTSQGDPEKIKNARDQLTAAIVGLLFIIFSLVILQLITSDVLGLPGFGG